jgi:type VI secretion system secreted protein VgrG
MEAYALPDNKTRSVWRSQTIGQTGQDYAPAENPPAGGGAGWNEISMEDTSGKELLLVQAQRDRETTVRRDDKFTLGRDQTHRVGHDRSVAIKNDDTLSIEQGNMSIDVKLGDYSLKTDAGSVKIEAMQQITLTVGQNSIKIDQTGITLSGLNIQVQAQVALSAQAPQVSLDGEASMSIAGGVVMIN